MVGFDGFYVIFIYLVNHWSFFAYGYFLIDCYIMWFSRGLLVVYNAMYAEHSFNLSRIVIFCVHRIIRLVWFIIWLSVLSKTIVTLNKNLSYFHLTHRHNSFFQDAVFC